MKQGDLIAVRIDEEYLEFINYCFANVLIRGVDVQIINVHKQRYILILRIAAPGIDRINNAIEKFNGLRLF